MNRNKTGSGQGTRISLRTALATATLAFLAVFAVSGWLWEWPFSARLAASGLVAVKALVTVSLGSELLRKLTRGVRAKTQSPAVAGAGAAGETLSDDELSETPGGYSDAEGAAELPESEPEPKLWGRVLVVEDCVATQRMLAYDLRSMGLQVDMSGDGVEAMELLEEMPIGAYSLVITDLEMPRVDGCELVKRARMRGWRVPFIALTSHTDAESRRRVMDAGCDVYSGKPISRTNLKKLCREWIGRKSTWGTTAAKAA